MPCGYNLRLPNQRSVFTSGIRSTLSVVAKFWLIVRL